MAPLVDPVVPLALRAALSLLFAAAALHKLRDLANFRAAFAEYRVLPGALLHIGVWLVPALEAGVALALAAPGRLGPVAAAALLTAYGAAIALNLARGRRQLDCGCLGPGQRQPISGALVARNALLAAGALACLLPAAPRALVWLDFATIAAAAVCLALFWLGAHQALALRPHLAALRGDS
ncbi:MAG TPA: MauE/DoxX family redox-associated membrane protein [Myxococcota bacterium]|nr:MauE/DoxX family redox-associated membrane protein [Myxococcota bacterium]